MSWPIGITFVDMDSTALRMPLWLGVFFIQQENLQKIPD